MQGFPKSEKTSVGISRFALTKSWNFRIRFLEISVIPGCGLEIDVDMIQGRGVRVPRFLSQHIGIPTFQCKGVEIPSLYTGTMYIGTPGSEQVVSGIPNSNPMVSEIPNLDLRISESLIKIRNSGNHSGGSAALFAIWRTSVFWDNY